MPGSWRKALVLAAVLGAAGSLRANGTPAFYPALDVFVSSAAPSANSDIRIAASVPPGNPALGTGALFLPAGWGVSGDSPVFDGDVVARGTMSVDTDCNGGIDSYGPFNLTDTPTGGGPDAPVALWDGQISSWWSLRVTVDQAPSQPYDMGADLTNISQLHTFCGPQTLVITVLGRSLPHQNVVVTNPSSAGSYDWGGSFTSSGGGYMALAGDTVCIGNACDADSDSRPDVSDNCPFWPNANQALPAWLIAANDPDCDGFASAVEDLAGTKALVQCGLNAWPADATNDTFSDISDVTALTNAFGLAVPPASARYNIAPDTPDAFVDISDVSKMTNFFGLTCAPCAADSDCDGVVNATDNCPNWPNPTQALPTWLIAVNDPDCDGFSTAVENAVGTSALVQCGTNAWPADTNNDTFSDISDVTALTNVFGSPVTPATARYDIAPDPPDHFVDISDVSKMTNFFALHCV
jgi:Thrombospondin type 3 repeat